MTPKDHMSHDLSYFSGPRTSGAAKKEKSWKYMAALDKSTYNDKYLWEGCGEKHSYQHNRGCSREWLKSCVRWSPWQSRSLWAWVGHWAVWLNTVDFLAAESMTTKIAQFTMLAYSLMKHRLTASENKDRGIEYICHKPWRLCVRCWLHAGTVWPHLYSSWWQMPLNDSNVFLRFKWIVLVQVHTVDILFNIEDMLPRSVKAWSPLSWIRLKSSPPSILQHNDKTKCPNND